MGMFDQREDAFEKHEAVAQDLRFKALARRNKLLGLWAAELQGLTGDAAQSYAQAFMEAEVGRDDDGALTATIASALAASHPELSAHRIGRKIEETMALAAQQISQGR